VFGTIAFASAIGWLGRAYAIAEELLSQHPGECDPSGGRTGGHAEVLTDDQEGAW